MPVNFVKVTNPATQVTIRSSGQTLVVPLSRKVEIVTPGKVGPSGPQGASAEGAFEWVTQTFQLAAPQQEFELDFTPRAGSVFVYLNGLLEQFWSLMDATVTLDDSAVTGDTVVITYQKEI